MRIVTLNANGIRSASRKGLFDWLPAQDADVVCLQETRCQDGQRSDEMFRPPGYHSYYLDAARKGYSGVAIYSRARPLEVITGYGSREFDAEGRYIDFHNTVILLTTNVGTDLIMSMCKDPELLPDVEGLAQALRAPLRKTFPPALLGRIVTIPYYPLSDEMLGTIIRLQLDRIVRRIADNHRAPLTYDEAVVKLIAARCAEVESGARVVDAILTNTVLPAISRELLNRTIEGKPIGRVAIGVGDSGFSYSFE
jgi:hypothetical protein